MFRKSSLLIVAVALVLAAPVAHGASARTFMINVDGGANLPMGDFKDANLLGAKTGYQFGGGADYMVTDKVAIGVDASYNKNQHRPDDRVFDLGGGYTGKLDKGTFTILQFGAHAKWMFPMHESPISPYALIGVGVYNGKQAITNTITFAGADTKVSSEDKFDTRLGGRIGLGATYKVTDMVGIGVEGDYNYISEDEAKTNGSSSIRYIGIHAGVSFSIAPPK
jgi:opacity protein-like surface antigen